METMRLTFVAGRCTEVQNNGTYVMSDDDLDAVEEAYKDTAKQKWSEVRETFQTEFTIRPKLGLS